MWRSYHSWWVRHIRAYGGAPCKGVPCGISPHLYEDLTKNGGSFDIRADASHPPFIHPEDYRARSPGQCGGAHATICPLRGGPSLCDGWCATTTQHQVTSRHLTSHPQNVYLQALEPTDDCTQTTSCGFFRDLFRAKTAPSRCILPCSVARIPAACTTRSSLPLCASSLQWD